jgi:hypothetical protein
VAISKKEYTFFLHLIFVKLSIFVLYDTNRNDIIALSKNLDLGKRSHKQCVSVFLTNAWIVV